MAITVTPNLTPISLCDATTGWTAQGGTNSLNDPSIFGQVQGNYCIQNYASNATDRGSDYDLGSGGTDLQNQTIYAWFAFNKIEILQVKGASGLRIRVTDTSSNWGEWDIAGSDTLPHAGWICWAVRTNQSFQRNGGTPPNLALIRYVGWRAGSVASKGYVYFDAWRYGSGLTIDGGTSGTPASFEELYLADNDSNNKYGVITKQEGVYFIQGVLTIGSASQTQTTYFKSVNKTIIFKDANVGTGFYQIIGKGASGYATTIYIGEKVGSSGINGNVFNAAGSSKYMVTMDDQYVTTLGIYGCSFYNANTITLPAYSVNKEALNCNFTASAEVIADTCTITDCNFISAPGNAIQMNSESHHITKCNFINCSRGVDITAGSTFSFNALIFSSCTYDVLNATGGAITINTSNLSNPSTVENDNASIVSSATLKLTGLIDNTEVRIYNHSDSSELAGVENSSGGTFQWDYNPSTYSNVDIQVLNLGYIPIWYSNVSIDSNGLTIPIQQQLDRQYANP